MTSILAKHGYAQSGGEMRPKPYRPKTIGDAKILIVETFERNRWDDADQARYFAGKGIKAERLDDLVPEDIRTVLASMEKSRMILFIG